jgi:hypothetical protein
MLGPGNRSGIVGEIDRGFSDVPLIMLLDANGNLQLPVDESAIRGYLDLVRLTPLMERTRGTGEIRIGLVDGPVAIDHPDLATENIREVPGERAGTCALLHRKSTGDLNRKRE